MADTQDGGTIRGQLKLDVEDAIGAYTKARQAHIATVTALRIGGDALQTIGQGFVGVAQTMAGGLIDAAMAAGEFERKLDFFSAVSGATVDQFEAIREKALQLGEDTIYSADQVADAFTELAKSGVGVNDLLDGIGEAVTYLGAATDIPLTEAATSLTSILNTFSISAEDAVSVVDKLAGAANASSIDVNDLIITMTYAGASAKTAGVSFEDVNTAIALLGKNGIKGSKAGTGLRQMFDKLIAPTNKGKDALEALGIITEDGANALLNMDGTLRPIPELLDALNEPLSKMTASEKMDILGQIFPITSLPTILNLLSDGSAAMAELNGEINKTTAMEIAGERLDNLSGDIEILSGNLDTLRITVGATLQPIARAFVQAITAIVQVFGEMPAWVQTSIVVIIALIAVFSAIIGVVLIFVGALLNVAASAYILSPILGTLLPGILASLSTAFHAATAAARVFALALITNPWVYAIAAILAVIGTLIYFQSTGVDVGGMIVGVFNNIVSTIQSILPVLIGAFLSIVGQLGTLVSGAIAALTTILPQVLAAIVSAVTTLLGILPTLLPQLIEAGINLFMGLVQAVMVAIPIVISALVTAIPLILAAIVSAIPLLITAALSLFLGLVGALVLVLPMLIAGLLTLILQLITAILTAIPMLLEAGLQLFLGLLQALVTAIPMIIQGLTQLIVGVITAVVGMIPMLLEAAITLFMGLLEGLTTALPLIIEGLSTGLIDIITAITEMLPDLIEGAVTLFTGLIEALITVIPILITAITTLLPQLITTIVSLIPMLIQGALSLFMGLVQGLVKVIPLLITAIVDLIPMLITTLVNMIPLIIQAAIQLFTGILDGLLTAIPLIITALVELIPMLITVLIEMIPMLLDAAILLFTSILDALITCIPQIIDAVIKMIPQIVNALVAAAPQLANAGVQLIQGLINGIGSMAGALWDAAMNMAGNLVNSVKDALGIKSPSIIMDREVGVQVGAGVLQGVLRTRKTIANAMKDLVTIPKVDTSQAVNSLSSLSKVWREADGLKDLSSSVAASREMSQTVTVVSAKDDEQKLMIKKLIEKIDAFAPGDTITATVTNAVPEPASDSLPKVIRRATYKKKV